METTEIININKEGAARTIEYNIESEYWWPTYQQMLTIFMRQGGIIDEFTVVVSGDDISINLLAYDGTLLHMRIADFFRGKTKLPIQGDYVLAARNRRFWPNNATLSESELEHHKEIFEEIRANSNSSWEESDLYSSVKLTATDNSNYNREYLLSDSWERPVTLSLGLSSMALPIRTQRQILSPVSIKCVRTGTFNNNNQRIVQNHTEAFRTMLNRGLEIPLMMHLSTTSATAGYGWNNHRLGEIKLMTRKNTAIVHEKPDNPLTLTGVKLLCFLEKGTIKKILSKTAKKRPFGLVELHFDSEKDTACIKVINLKGEAGEREYEEVATKINNIAISYKDSNANLNDAASASYGTIFDLFLSSRQNNPSIANARAMIESQGLPDGTDIQEIIGISRNGKLVVGIDSPAMTVMCSTGPVTRYAAFDKEYMEKTATGPKKPVNVDMHSATQNVLKHYIEETKAEQEASLYPSSSHYPLWKEYSDEWHLARGISPLPKEVGPVFMTYMNSGEVQQEDIDEYNRLLLEEEE